MTNRVQTLLAFHRTRSFGSRENLIARQREARAVYRALTPDEQAELGETVLARAGHEGHRVEQVLCCLACFRPGSLTPFHEDLVRRRILYPGVIHHGAGGGVAAGLMALLEGDEHRNLALLALAWVGDETVQGAFAEWRAQPPRWASELHVPPARYCHEAGWELTREGGRRDLFQESAYLPPRTSEWDAFPVSPLVLSGETRHFLQAANWSMLPGVEFSQVGGLATWVQDAEYPACPECSRTMPLVGQISNDDFMEYGEGIYYAFHCAGCGVTATNYQQS
jgi:hypothetical protein